MDFRQNIIVVQFFLFVIMSQIYMKHQDELEASYIMLCIIDFSMRQIKKENIYNMIYFKFLVSFTTNFV